MTTLTNIKVLDEIICDYLNDLYITDKFNVVLKELSRTIFHVVDIEEECECCEKEVTSTLTWKNLNKLVYYSDDDEDCNLIIRVFDNEKREIGKNIMEQINDSKLELKTLEQRQLDISLLLENREYEDNQLEINCIENMLDGLHEKNWRIGDCIELYNIEIYEEYEFDFAIYTQNEWNERVFTTDDELRVMLEEFLPRIY
jgi:hypothetical protein